MAPKKTLIIGALGQLGRALPAEFPGADLVDLDELDVTDPAAVAAWPWHEYGVVLNAAAYTAVDAAETPDGRRTAWAANAAAPATLARLAGRARLHARALLDRLRLRRHRRTRTPRTSRSHRWASTPRARPPATWPWPPRRGTTCCAPRG